MTEKIIKFRYLVIILSIVVCLALGILIPFSQTDPEIRNYVPQNMLSRIQTDSIEAEFGVQDMVMILFTDTMVLTKENLDRMKKIDRGLAKLSGISTRISPFTVRSIKNSEGMMVVDPLIPRVPEDEEGLEKLRIDLLGNKFAKDIVVSSDMTVAAITANINTSERENVILQKIDSLITITPGKANVYVAGLPYIRRHIMKDVRVDAVVLVPLALIIMIFILKLTLGRWKYVFMPFSVILLSMAACMGLVPLIGWKISIITLLVPIILIAVANNYGIYLVSRYRDVAREYPSEDKESLIVRITSSLNMPILFSGLTTIAGIAGLLTHSIIPARQVGVLAGAGVSLALLMSMSFIPALLLTGRQRKNEVSLVQSKISFEKLLNFLTKIILKSPGRIILIFSVMTIIIASGAVFLKIETNQEKYFPKNNPVRVASEVVNQKFGGSQTISVMISGDILDPAVMGGIDSLADSVKQVGGIGNVFSISDAVREMSRAIFTEGEIGYDQIPETREGIAQMFELYNMSGDPEDFRQLLSIDNTRAHLIIRLSRPENDVIRSVKDVTESFSGRIPAKITIGGYAIIMSDFASSIIKGQFSSLLFALVTVFILLSVVFRSARGGLIGSLPLFASILILFGFMGISGIALDAATALLSSIMIGVGVDFTIQYIWCFNENICRGQSVEEATVSSMKIIGRSIIINALSVMAGFSALVFSGFTSIRFFGYLVIISIGSCLIGALILIPAIIVRYRPGFIFINMKRKSK